MRTRPIAAIAAIALASAALVVPACAQGTAKPKSSLNSQINSQFPDNNVGAITPQILRTVTQDMVASSQQYAGVNAQVGTSYTIQTSDYGQLITFSNPAPIAVSLPSAQTSGFSPFNVYISNLGVGVVTITPTTGTINGVGALQVGTGTSIWVVSDGTNYQISRGASPWGVSGNNIYNLNSGNVGIGTSSPDTKLDVIGTISMRRTTATDMGGTLQVGHGAYAWQLLGNQIAGGDLLLKNPGATNVLLFPETGGCVGIASGALPPCTYSLDVGANTGNAGIRINSGAGVPGQGAVLAFKAGPFTIGQLGSDCYLVSAPCNGDFYIQGQNNSRTLNFWQWGGVTINGYSTTNPTAYVGAALNVRTQNSNNLFGGNGIAVQSIDDTNVRNLPVAITGHMIAQQTGNSDWGIYTHCDINVAAECASIEGTIGNTQGTPNPPPAASVSVPTMPFSSSLKMTCGQTLSNTAATHYDCSVGLWGKYYKGAGGKQMLFGVYLDEGFTTPTGTGIFVGATATDSPGTSAEFRSAGGAANKGVVIRNMGASSANLALDFQNSAGASVSSIQFNGVVNFTNGGTIQSLNQLTLLNAGSGSFTLQIRPNTTMTANRILDIAMDANRTVTLGGNLSLGGNLTTASGKTFTVNNTLTLSGTDGSTLNVGAGGTLGTAAFVNTGTSGGTVPLLNGSGIVWTNPGTWGTGTGVIQNAINGGNSGTAGSAVYIQAAGSTTGAIGNESGILGGSYVANILLYSTGILDLYAGAARAARINTSGGVSIGTTTDAGAGMLRTNASTFMIRTSTSYANGAGASTGTLTNAPAATNPTKWIPIDDNGTTRYVPAW